MRQRWIRYYDDAVRPRLAIIRDLPVAGIGAVSGLAAVNIVLGLLPVAFMLAMGFLIGRVPAAVSAGLGSRPWQSLVDAFIVASAAFFAQQVLAPLATSVGEVLKHRVDGRFRDRLIAVSLRSTGIGPLEDQRALDSLREAAEQLQTNFRTPGDAIVGTLAYVLRYTQLLGYLGVLVAATSWPAALPVLVSVMCFRYGHRGGVRVWVGVGPTVIRPRRERDYFRGLGLASSTAKEVRVFGLIEWIVERYRASALASVAPMWRARRLLTRRFLWFTAVGVLLVGALLALLVRSAATGDLTITQLVLAMQATIAAVVLGDYYHEADDATAFGMLAARALDDFEARVTELAGPDGRDEAAAGRSAAGLPAREVRFAGVSFRYEGSPQVVLDGLELRLHAGQCTALVGLNGAGKSTLVKLLTRLHEPTGGRLLVDGADVRELAVDSWRRQIAVIFQTFNRYELTAAENIAWGAVHAPYDESAVRSAAADADILPALEMLPRGLQTVLGRHYEDGAELSGGQWQRLALARVLYAVRAGARVLVLDEPTAALDVRAEAAFFNRFVELTRGITTLLISHRFSSVRHADRIVLLEDGRVVEDGTHDELVARGNRYAHMFLTQAQQFRDGLQPAGLLDDNAGAAR